MKRRNLPAVVLVVLVVVLMGALLGKGKVYFIRGFDASSGSKGPACGMDSLYTRYVGLPAHDAAVYYDHWDVEYAVVADILSVRRANPSEHFVIVGHSYGAMTAIQIARSLRYSITIDLLVLADAVDTLRTGNNTDIPPNVTRVVNRYQTGGLFHGAPVTVHGTLNEGDWTGLLFKDPATGGTSGTKINHTNIDDDLDFQTQALAEIQLHDTTP